MIQSEGAVDRWPLVRSVLTAGLVLLPAALVLVYFHHLLGAALYVAAISLLLLSYRWPMPMVAVEMLLSTSAFKFAGVQSWPHVIRDVPLDPPDIMILLFFVVGTLKLARRGESPLFLGSLLLFGTVAALSAVLAPLMGTQTLYQSLNGLRQLSGYLFYFGLVGVIDSPGRLRWLVRIIFAFVLLSAGIQALEVLRGEQFVAAVAPFNEYYAAQISVSAGGMEAPYLWNRAGGYLLVGLFLALGQGLWTGSLVAYGITLVAAGGYAVQLIRQWYAFIALGGLVSVLLLRRNRLRILAGLASLGLVLALAMGVAVARGIRLPAAQLWLGRIATLAKFWEEPNFVFRVQTWLEEWRLFRQAPLFGHGPGSANRLGASSGMFTFFDADTGMPNTLLQYGLLGTAAAWVLIGAFLRRAWRLHRSLQTVAGRGGSRTAPTYRGYVAGLLALGVVIVVGYLTTQDFISYVELAYTTGLALALVDRIWAFAPREA